MKADTVFDRILRRELPVRVVHEDQDVLAFHDAHPQAPVHVLVIPKKKVTSLDQLGELSAEEAGRFLQAVAAVARGLGLVDSGYRVVINCGKDANQSVDYLRHILGRRHCAGRRAEAAARDAGRRRRR
jgi:histidine triad (HIT) family protein